MARSTVAVLAVLLAAGAQGYTLPSQIDALLAFKAVMDKRGGNWTGNLATWTCPTPPATTSPNQTCDPCGRAQWWGNWPYVGCRGFTIKGEDVLGGNGVTNLHFTNTNVEGPNLPIQEICDVGLTKLKEMDIDGNDDEANPIAGTIPEVIASCFPYLDATKLSYNKLTGTLPAFFSNITGLQNLKVRGNLMTGTIPNEVAAMPILYFLDLAENKFSGTIPPAFRQSQTMSELTLANNDFEGPLYNMPQNLLYVETSNNARLCGMIPGGVRWAHGFNPANTSLGKPCPGETYPVQFPAGF